MWCSAPERNSSAGAGMSMLMGSGDVSLAGVLSSGLPSPIWIAYWCLSLPSCKVHQCLLLSWMLYQCMLPVALL